MGAYAQAEVVPVVEEEGGEAPRIRPGVAAVPRAEPPRGTAEVPTALLAAILARLEMAPAATGAVPAWLAEAIGNPLTYDAAAAHRKDVCVRVDPGLYRRLQGMKERLALRTTAGAWEYVLRAGLEVAERGVGRDEPTDSTLPEGIPATAREGEARRPQGRAYRA